MSSSEYERKRWDEFLARPDLTSWQIRFNPGKPTVAQIKGFRDHRDYVTFDLEWSAAHTLRGWTRRHHKLHTCDTAMLLTEGDGTLRCFGDRFIPPGHEQIVSESAVVAKVTRN